MSWTSCADPGEKTMNHDDAVKLMAVERYLLDELASELRDEFEEHMFDCVECSLDLRAGNAFVEEAKLQLPELAAQTRESARAPLPQVSAKAGNRADHGFSSWLAWLRPAFAVPTFAALLALIAYQNLETIPSLRAAAMSPRLAPWVSFHTATRGAAHLDVPADRKLGAAVVIELSRDIPYASYTFVLDNPEGKQFWTQTVSASSLAGSGAYTLTIPGAGLEQGSYTLVITGISAQGAQTETGRRILDVHFDD